MLGYISTITKFGSRLRKDKAGVTAIEYGLIAGAIAVAIIAGAFTIGTNIGSTFNCVGSSLTAGSDKCASTTTN